MKRHNFNRENLQQGCIYQVSFDLEWLLNSIT